MAPVSVQKAELRSTTTSRQGQCNDGAEELPSSDHSKSTTSKPASEPLESGSHEASITSRLTCASIMTAIFAVWAKLTFVTDGVPGGTSPLHSWKFPVMMNIAYLVSLPLLRLFTDRYLSKAVDVKSLLKEAMLIYNVGQVLVNFWMVCSFIVPVASGAHPFIGGGKDMVETGVTYAVWVHYCNKYLEYMDTYFMVLRGRMDQVREKDINGNSVQKFRPHANKGFSLGLPGFFSSRLPSYFDFYSMVDWFETVPRRRCLFWSTS